MQRLLLSALAFFILLSPLAANPSQPAPTKPPQATTPYEFRIFRVSSSGFAIPDSKAKTNRFIARSLDAIPLPKSETQFDVSPYFRENGVTSPTGSLAIFDASTSQLVIWNTRENIELVQQLVGSEGCTIYTFTRISIIEYIPKSDDESLPDSMAVSEFLKHIKRKVRTLAENSGITCYGTPLNFSQIIGNESADDSDAAKPFPAGESGLKANIIPTYNVFGATNLQIQCRFRNAPALTNGKSVNVFFTSDLTLWNGHPVVIHTGLLPADPHGDKKPHKFAIIVCTGFVNAGGWKTDIFR